MATDEAQNYFVILSGTHPLGVSSPRTSLRTPRPYADQEGAAILPQGQSLFFFFLSFFDISLAAPVAYGGSQARG